MSRLGLTLNGKKDTAAITLLYNDSQEKVTGIYHTPGHFKAFLIMSRQPQTTTMATYPEDKPFPLTPYPFCQPNADESTSLASISEWLELPGENEAHDPESNALTPEEWIACNGQEDTTWVVGEPDWLDEGTKNVDIVSGRLLGLGSTSSSDGSIVSPDYDSSSQDTDADFDQPQDQVAEHPLLPDVSNQPIQPGSNPLRGVIRRGDSEDEVQLPERKRPRLERCKQSIPIATAKD